MLPMLVGSERAVGGHRMLAPQEQEDLLGQLAYHHHPAGPALEHEIAEEIEDLKLINVFRANADSKALAKKFTFNVFA